MPTAKEQRRRERVNHWLSVLSKLCALRVLNMEPAHVRIAQPDGAIDLWPSKGTLLHCGVYYRVQCPEHVLKRDRWLSRRSKRKQFDKVFKTKKYMDPSDEVWQRMTESVYRQTGDPPFDPPYEEDPAIVDWLRRNP